MSTDTVSKGAVLKTTTAARVVATSHPAENAAEAQKIKINRRIFHSTEDTPDARPVIIPVLSTLTIVTVSVPAEAVCVDETNSNTSIVTYSPSKPDGSPPPFSRISNPTPAHSSQSKGTIPISSVPSSPHQPKFSFERTPIETAAGRSKHPRGRIPRQPNKYTEATMPAIHDATPYAPLRHMDLDLVDEWEKCPEGKLFAHPFDSEACQRDLHGVKNKIFAAVIEITNSQHVAVSPPRPSQVAIEAGCTPTCFLIYHLTEDARQILLERRVWSSQSITFPVTAFYPPCPDFLFSISRFTTTNTDMVRQVVHSVWHDDTTRTFLDSVVEDFPQGERANANQALSRFIASMWVTLLPIKQTGNILAPRFNVYANGSLILQEDIWKRLRSFLADRVYASLLLDTATTEVAPYRCGLCRSVDHPMGLCPFPNIEGWNGPNSASKKDRIINKSRARGQLRNTIYGATGR